MFCVYSGDGVNQLRAYLRLNGPQDEEESADFFPSNGTVLDGQYQHQQLPQVPFGGPFHPSNAQHSYPHGGQHQQLQHYGQPSALLPPPPPPHVMPPHLSTYWRNHALATGFMRPSTDGQQQQQAGPVPPPPPAAAHVPPHTGLQGLQGTQAATQVPFALTGDDADVDDEDVDGDGDEDMRAGDD